MSRYSRTTSLLTLLLGTVVLLAAASAPRQARADPHAVFYTTKGQEQLFYNVLAALNQADYVEEPGRPPIESVREQGEAIRTGTIKDSSGEVIGQARPEPSERVALPRIRVRTVTSDDGDVYYRELAYRRALAEKIRVELAKITCKFQYTVYGEPPTKDCLALQ